MNDHAPIYTHQQMAEHMMRRIDNAPRRGSAILIAAEVRPRQFESLRLTWDDIDSTTQQALKARIVDWLRERGDSA